MREVWILQNNCNNCVFRFAHKECVCSDPLENECEYFSPITDIDDESLINEIIENGRYDFYNNWITYLGEDYFI